MQNAVPTNVEEFMCLDVQHFILLTLLYPHPTPENHLFSAFKSQPQHCYLSLHADC